MNIDFKNYPKEKIMAVEKIDNALDFLNLLHKKIIDEAVRPSIRSVFIKKFYHPPHSFKWHMDLISRFFRNKLIYTREYAGTEIIHSALGMLKADKVHGDCDDAAIFAGVALLTLKRFFPDLKLSICLTSHIEGRNFHHVYITAISGGKKYIVDLIRAKKNRLPLKKIECLLLTA